MVSVNGYVCECMTEKTVMVKGKSEFTLVCFSKEQVCNFICYRWYLKSAQNPTRAQDHNVYVLRCKRFSWLVSVILQTWYLWFLLLQQISGVFEKRKKLHFLAVWTSCFVFTYSSKDVSVNVTYYPKISSSNDFVCSFWDILEKWITLKKYRKLMWRWFVKAVWAHLCAHNVRQRLVCDWDVAEKLSDLNTWDGAVERHKESKDRAQSEKDRENEES